MSQLNDFLQTLEILDLIKQKKTTPQLEYAFKHVFTQESVYNSLLRSDRQQLHLLVGRAMEALYAADTDEVALMLAGHFEAGGDRERALKYLKIAAAEAAGRFANEEATELYQRALNLLAADDYANRWDLMAELEQIYDRRGQRDRQASALTILQTLAELIEDNDRLARTHNRRAGYFDRISEYDESAAAAQTGLRLAQQGNDDHVCAQSFNLLAQAAWRCFDYEAVKRWANYALDAQRLVGEPKIRTTSLLHLGRTSYRLGEYDAALEYILAAQNLASASDNPGGEAVCHLILGWIYQRLGDYEQSRQHFWLDLEKRRAIGDRYGEAEALSHLGWVYYDLEDYQMGLSYCQMALSLSGEIDDRENEAYALSGMGLNTEGLGQPDQAGDFYHQALALHRSIKAYTLVMFDLSRLALLELQAGQPQAAYTDTAEVLEWTSQHGIERFWDPWLIHYSNYQVLKANGQAEQAQAILEEAYTLLRTRAKRISNPQLRGYFLERAKTNRMIAQTYQAQTADHPSTDIDR